MNVDFDRISFDEARMLRKQLEALLNSEGWQIVQQLVDSRVDGQRKSVEQVIPESMEQLVRFATVKGRIEELKFFPSFVEQVYIDLQGYVERAADDEQMEMNYDE